MQRTISRHRQFIPEWSRNREEATPLVVHYRLASTEERDKWVHWSNPTMESTGGTDHVSKVERIIERREMFLGMVEKITAFTVIDDGKEVVIDTPRKILETPSLNDLYDEIVIELINSTALVDVKN